MKSFFMKLNLILILLSLFTLVACQENTIPGNPDFTLNSSDKIKSFESIISLEKDDIKFQYSKAKKSRNGHVMLEHTGLFANLSPFDKIEGIIIKYHKKDKNANLNLYYGQDVLPLFNETNVKSGRYISLKTDATFFVIQESTKPYKPDDFYPKDDPQEFQLRNEPSVIIDIISVEIYLGTNDLNNEQMELPKIYIDVELDNNGNPLPILNKTDYVNSKIKIVDLNNPQNNLGDLEGLDAGIRLRGNSTRTRPKKPYKIKFSKKQTLFGLPEAKDWALLADYMDGSGLHNYTALTLAAKLDSFKFVGCAIFVELYLNGQYQGLYLLNEHQEANKGRVEITQTLTDNLDFKDFNFMIELDRSTIFYPDNEIEGIDYFKIEYDPESEYGTHYFSIKYPKKKDFEKAFGVSEETNLYFKEFFSYIENYVIDLLDSFETKNDYEKFKEKVDLETLLSFLLIDFIMVETDHKFQSFKMHYIAEEEKLYFGPIWDYDSKVMGLPYEKVGVDYPFDKAFDKKYVLPYKSKTIHNPFFKGFVTNYKGLNELKNYYREEGAETLLSLINELKKDTASYISNNLIADANIWYDGNLSMIFENLKYTIKFLELRKEFLDTYLK